METSVIEDDGFSVTASRTYHTEIVAAALVGLRFSGLPLGKSVKNVTTGIGILLLLNKYAK